MLLEYSERKYINVDEIQLLRMNRNGLGTVVIGGVKVTLTSDEFDVIEKAYLQQWKHSLYDKNLVKGRI